MSERVSIHGPERLRRGIGFLVTLGLGAAACSESTVDALPAIVSVGTGFEGVDATIHFDTSSPKHEVGALTVTAPCDSTGEGEVLWISESSFTLDGSDKRIADIIPGGDDMVAVIYSPDAEVTEDMATNNATLIAQGLSAFCKWRNR